MAIDIRWLNKDKTILIQSYSGMWTLREYRNAAESVYAMLNSVSHRVDIVVDLTDSATLTADLLTYARQEANEETVRIHNNQRRTTVVGASLLLRTMIEFASEAVPWVNPNAEYMDSMEEAIEFLEESTVPSVFTFKGGHTRPLQAENGA